MRILLVVLCVLVGTVGICGAEQKVVFVLDSVKVSGFSKRTCEGECAKKFGEFTIEDISNGWKIINIVPKELVGADTDYVANTKFSCSCVGNQYLLQKDDPIPATANTANKDIEALRKDVEFLKQEVAELKAKAAPKKKPSK